MSISQVVRDFAACGILYGGYMELDRIYLQNRILGMIGEKELEEGNANANVTDPAPLLEELIHQAIKNQVIEDTPSQKEVLESQLMDFLTPPPSVVNALFAQHYSKTPKEATDYFFQLSKVNDYIKTKQIAKNIVFPTKTPYGELEITINLSKPEKDPKEIAQAKLQKKSSYPKCLLCMENEGYLGGINHPARTNHRIIRLNLNGESWGFQYSPYAYYNEHCIVLAEQHQPMEISEQTFKRLLTIVDIFPHYFIGSNADLPIVGGSILTHDHYQGGNHEFPMAKAEMEQLYPFKAFPKVILGKVKWPMSVLRLQGTNQEELVKAAQYILEKWQAFSKPELEINAQSKDGTKHHTITPIARKKDNYYELDLVLRDNNVSEKHPDGIFHPHKDVQHIKKENIGLIEVMGLAVLPPRLKPELKEVEKFLLNEENDIKEMHLDWAKEMKEKYPDITSENVEKLVQQEVGQIFMRVLEDAGVFKRDEKGQAAFDEFIQLL